MFDSVWQYEQALSGDYSDWHPPIMARAWSLFLPWWPGTGGPFLVQMLLWWGGLALLASALARTRRHGAAAWTLAVGACPLFLGWASVVLKDAQMAACLVAAVGIAAPGMIEGRRRSGLATAAIPMLLVYATLARGNAVFATVPLGCALLDWGGLRRPWACAALAVAAGTVSLLAAPLVNHRLLGAEASHVERALPLYDIAGTAHFARVGTIPGLTPGAWAAAERRGCYTPYFWNPYGEDSQCGAIGEALAFGPSARVLPLWLGTVAAHPLAYVMHRAVHVDSNLRFLVGAGEPDAVPPVDPEPNGDGLGRRSGPAGRALIAGAGALAASPIGWPFAWAALAAALMWAAWGSPGGTPRLGRALALSAVCMSGSFAVVSIASDLRYHLWSMVAAALALPLLAPAAPPHRRRVAAAATVALILAGGAARLLLPPPYVPLPPPAAT